MGKRLHSWVSIVALAALVVLVGCSGSDQATLDRLGLRAESQRYVVVVDSTGRPGNAGAARAEAAAVARDHGLEPTHLYGAALVGFAAEVPGGRLEGLRRDPRISYVEEDRTVTIYEQEIPTGISRSYATGNPSLTIDGSDDLRVDVDVAIIDTGIDFDHPDLNIVGGVDCTGGGPFRSGCKDGGDDDHYHGTHVAGTVGAIDNGIGVVGVAPGARLWAVKVLDRNGSGYTSWVVAGIDWVAENAGTIEVANMSLGGSGFSQAQYDAIAGAVERGVAFAVAAGNSDDDAAAYSPAGFDNVLTVSALADFDGAAGGLGSASCRDDQDDTLADFSNWGPAVDIAAPGVCILSTYPLEQGEYGTISGTSMASPHAAGALAVLASSGRASTAAEVDDLYATVTSTGNHDWTDDSGDGVHEPLLDLSDSTVYAASTSSGSGDGGSGGDDGGAAITLSASGYKVKGAQHVDLSWSGAVGAVVDVRRDGTVVATTENDGDHTDAIGSKGGGSYVYEVCEAGSAEECSDPVRVSF